MMVPSRSMVDHQHYARGSSSSRPARVVTARDLTAEERERLRQSTQVVFLKGARRAGGWTLDPI
jgi:hypothetical protein